MRTFLVARTARPVSLVSSVALVVVLAGCGGSFGRQTAAKALPSDGSMGGPPPASLELQMMSEGEWNKAQKDKIAPLCDARAASARADAPKLAALKKAVDGWAVAYAKKPKKPTPKPGSGPTVGQVVGLKVDTTRTVDSLTLECNVGGVNTLTVNGTANAFDLAWAVVVDAPPSVTVQAMSLKDNKVYFASVQTPSNPKYDTLETTFVTHVGNYMPNDMDEPLVTNMRSTGDPLLETLAFTKGSREGFYYLAPRTGDLTSGRFMEVGRFKVGAAP